MIKIVHCYIHDFNGGGIGNTTPIITESIIENGKFGVYNADDLRFSDTNNINESRTSEGAIQYNIFRNLETGIKSRLFAKHNISVIHNTFYNCEKSGIDTDSKYWDEYQEVFNFIDEDSIIKSNLFFSCLTMIQSKTLVFTNFLYNLLYGFVDSSIIELGDGNIGPGLIPLFYDEPNNLRLIVAGLYDETTDSTPVFDSPGSWKAHDGTNIGAYHLNVSEMIITSTSDESLFVESPPITENILKSLNASDNEGVDTQFSFSTKQVNRYTLDYPLEYAHERTRITHVIRMIRESKTPCLWFPFAKPLPRWENPPGLSFADNYFDFWKDVYINYVALGETPYYWNLTSIFTYSKKIPYSSFEEYEILEGTVDFPVHPKGNPSSMDLRAYIGVQVIGTDKETYFFSGIILGSGQADNSIKVYLMEKRVKDGEDFPTSSQISLSLSIAAGTVNYIEYDQENNRFKFGLPWSLPGMPLRAFDDFLITLGNRSVMKTFLEGTFPTPDHSHLFTGGVDEITSESYQDSFLLKSTGSVVDGEEIYFGYPINPGNYYNWKVLDGTDLGNVWSFFSYYSRRIFGYIDSLMIYPSQEDITSNTIAASRRDVFFTNSATWLAQFEQQTESTEGWGGQKISLLQTKPHRSILPFENKHVLEIDIQDLPPWEEEDDMPIGTIVAYHKDLPGAPALPSNWVECNGQILNMPSSPLHGQTIPDLNGERRFLRGSKGTAGGGDPTGTLEADSLKATLTDVDGAHGHSITDPGHDHTTPNHSHTAPNHQHTLNNHTHPVTDPGHSHTTTISIRDAGESGGAPERGDTNQVTTYSPASSTNTTGISIGAAAGSTGWGGNSATSNANPTTNSSSTNITIPSGSPHSHSIGGGTETKPLNMAVVWIIKVA